MRFGDRVRIHMSDVRGEDIFGVIEQTNQAVAEMLGYLESDLIGRKLSEITAWDSRCSNPRSARPDACTCRSVHSRTRTKPTT